MKLFISVLLLISFEVQASALSALELALTKTARRFAYEDSLATCGGKLIGYKLISENATEILVQAKFSADDNECRTPTFVTCNVVYDAQTVPLKEMSVRCQLP
jgi:hypothetical protein